MRYRKGATLVLVLLGAVHWNVGRRVHVRRVETAAKQVALTFDDGPNPPFTSEILLQLERQRVRATFFLIGRHIKRFPQLVDQMVAAGHEIGNHSYSHPTLPWVGWRNLDSEFSQTDDLIRPFAGAWSAPIRSPYGRTNPLFTWWLFWNRRTDILFDVQSSPPDYTRPDPHKIVESVVSQVRPGSIICLHDGEGTSAETVLAVPSIIEKLKSQGFEFLTVSELLRASRADPT